MPFVSRLALFLTTLWTILDAGLIFGGGPWGAHFADDIKVFMILWIVPVCLLYFVLYGLHFVITGMFPDNRY